MKKHLLLFLIFAVILALLIGPASSQEDMEVVEDAGFQKKQRPPAVFRHDEHNEKAEIDECNECHHIYENGEKLEDESSEDQLCSECHSVNSPDKRPNLVKAFHLNCKGCHRTKKIGPIMCGECHVR